MLLRVARHGILIALIGSALLFAGSCSESDAPDGPGEITGDVVPPAAIGDLSVTDSSATSLAVAWTAVGDDSAAGLAARYDLRYATEPVTDATWDGASQVPEEPSPAAAGSPQEMRVGGLAPGMTYWLAIRAFDEADNGSALGPAATGTTAEALAAGFGRPLGLQWDAAEERLLVCDNAAEQVYAVSRLGEVEPLLSAPGPVSVRSAAGGAFLVSTGRFSSPGGMLLRRDPGGGVDTLAAGDLQLGGIAVDEQGDVFYAQVLAGRVLRLAGGQGEPSLVWDVGQVIGGLAFDGDGELYAANLSTGSLLRYTPDGGEPFVPDGSFGAPLDLLYDPARDVLFVSDAGAESGGVFRVSLEGSVERIEVLTGPVTGLGLDGEGNLYYSTFAGEGESGAVGIIPAEFVGR